MKPILTSMTALAVVLATFSGAEAGQMPNINIKPKPQVLKIRPPRIHVPMRLGTAARLIRKNDQAPKDDGGPQPEPPTAPVARTVQPKKQLVAIPPLPRERPYNEFVETDTGADVGPDTALPEKDTLFDENLVAHVPGLWGNHVIDILEGFGEGAIDGAFDKEPGGGDGFGFGRPGQNDGRPGDLAGYNPDDHVQPGGPDDPAAMDEVPRFFDDPFNRNGNGESQGWSSPSEAVRDPRGMASDGYLPGQQWMSDNGAVHVGTAVEPGESGHTTWHDLWKTPRSEIIYTEVTDEDGNVVSGTATQEATIGDGKKRILRYFNRDENGVYQFVGDEIVHDDDIPDDEGSQPGVDPSTQEQAAAQAWICNTTPWLCRPGSVGSTPFEMLSQPSEGGGTGSIMGSGDGPDLGLEAVIQYHEFQCVNCGSGGGGSGGSSDWWREGDPDDSGPGGPID